MTDTFTITKKNRNKSKQYDFPTKLKECRETVKESLMFQDLTSQLQPIAKSVTSIRCLAIGSFTDDFPARYQLALLLEMVEYIKCTNELDKVLVSVFDPVFTDDDKNFIQSLGSMWTIDEEMPSKNFNNDSTFYFLPHAPLDLTEHVLIAEKPKYYLANNIIQHTDRYTASQLHGKYPVISKLVHLIQKNEDRITKDTETNRDDTATDGFTTFVSKRNRKNKKNDKYIFKEPAIDYSAIETYFKEAKVVTDFNNGEHLKDKPWVNSFSDLTFHIIN